MRPTAIAVMARPPIAGRCKTRLAASIGAGAAADLAAAMLRDVLQRGATVPAAEYVLLATPGDESHLHVFAVPPWRLASQCGADLGERMRHAVEELGAGGRVVVIIGSDSPTFPVSSLVSALPEVEPGRIVLAPADDGGYWATALCDTDTGIFDDIEWSRDTVYAATRARSAALGIQVIEAATGYDVDTRAELERLAAEIAADPSRAPHSAAWLASTSW